MERHFDQDLNKLYQLLLSMSAMTQEAIRRSIEALQMRDDALAQGVITLDRKIDELELSIDDCCIDMLALHQPMAGDLRFIAMAFKINAELERIADLAVDIAQRVLELSGQPILKPLIDIPTLSLIAQMMVKDAMEAFVHKDIALAKKVVLTDAEADALRNGVQEELINDYMAKDGACAPRAVPLLLIARHLERICDHATNIAEDVVYMVQAKVVRHHPEKLENGEASGGR